MMGVLMDMYRQVEEIEKRNSPQSLAKAIDERCKREGRDTFTFKMIKPERYNLAAGDAVSTVCDKPVTKSDNLVIDAIENNR